MFSAFCPVYDGGCIAISGKIIYLDRNSSNQGGSSHGKQALIRVKTEFLCELIQMVESAAAIYFHCLQPQRESD